MSKDKDNNSLNKLRNFFRSSKTNGTGTLDRQEFILTTAIETELKPESAITTRCKAIRELSDIVFSNKLEDGGIQKLLDFTKDMILPGRPIEQRQLVLAFYGKLIQGQYKDLSLLRAFFFRLIQQHNVPEDIHYRLELLKILTENGKDITHFEEEIGVFMLKWIPQLLEARMLAPFLEILVNIIKFNTACMDREIIVGIVQHVCFLSSTVDDNEAVTQCLQVLDAVICYTVFPNEILGICIMSLCRTVNKEAFCQTAYRIMKNLLGTQLGYASLLSMCSILNDVRYQNDDELLRGAIFHINMGLWGGSNFGSNSVMIGLKYSSTVLLSFLQALRSEHIIVTYEVILSIQTLVKKCGTELSEPSWDIVIDILELILANIEKDKLLDDHEIKKRFHSVLDSIEQLVQSKELNADLRKIYALIEMVAERRPESSVKGLLYYKYKAISVTRPNWLKNLNLFMDRFYRPATFSPNIRVKAIEYLKEIIEVNRSSYEEELLEKVIVIFADVAHDPDIRVRIEVSKLLLEICQFCETKRCLEVLDILEKIMNRLFQVRGDKTPSNDFGDVTVVVGGMINLFLAKLYRLPSSHAEKIYTILMHHLEQHDLVPASNSEAATSVLYQILEWMLRVRANASFQIGYPSPLTSSNIRYSHYLGIEGIFQHQPLSGEALPPPEAALTTISIKRGCRIVVKCLESEKDWGVLQLILKELPKIMQNKTLIQGNDIDLLARTLYNMYSDKTIHETVTGTKNRPTLTDVKSLVIPAVASLITYNQYLEIATRKKIVEILKMELIMDRNRSNLSIIVQTFTVLLMERCDTFERQLADILVAVSKVSDTNIVSIPILEFMSTITHLPYGFSNLNQKQFSYVFATCLPYTSPHRYDHYTVSLAHHILASWFLKSRLQWRKKYADYIIEGIAKNIDKSVQDAKARAVLPENPDQILLKNEDSSNRKRSTSLTERGYKGREGVQGLRSKEGDLKQKQQQDFSVHNFHVELIETCIDFMTRHTFSMTSALPKRLATADLLLRGGQSQTWIVGHNIITITTSGCSSNVNKNDMCDRCNSVCKHQQRKSGSQGTSEMGSKTLSSNSSLFSDKNSICACCCVGWSEIYIRRPTGAVSWVMKIQNDINLNAAYNNVTLHDLTAVFMHLPIDSPETSYQIVNNGNVHDERPKSITDRSARDIEEQLKKVDQSVTSSSEIAFTPISKKSFEFGPLPPSSCTNPINIPAHQMKSDFLEDDHELYENNYDVAFYDEEGRSRNPVRRVNSSPEMGANFRVIRDKNIKDGKSFSKYLDEEGMTDMPEEVQQKKKVYQKDTKVSCEAIPEEITAVNPNDEPHVAKTRPTTLLSSISATETANVAIVPKKQLSADDTFQLRRELSVNLETTNHNKDQKLIAKPPHAPNTFSPRFMERGMANRQVASNTQIAQDNDDSGGRARSKTISVISRENQASSEFTSFEQQSTTSTTSGISPSFVFLQLYHTGKINMPERPIPVPEKHIKSMMMLDLMPPFEIHHVGVLYVGPGQANNEQEILRNRGGSLRYTNFLKHLGQLVAIKDAKKNHIYVNLEESGRDGNFTYVWHDDIVQVIFHVATLMPNKESDPNCNEKKKHIGNDYVTIVYNESGKEYDLNTITSQFNYASIVVQPLELGSNSVYVRAKGDIFEYFKHLQPKILTDYGAPLLARQLALHANMASLVAKSLKTKNQSPYASNWLERLRKIKHFKAKVVAEMDQTPPEKQSSSSTSSSSFVKDVFTRYT